MPVNMTEKIDRVEVITSVQRRRRWSAEEKARMVQETYAPGMTVSLVARQHGIAPNQLFSWRRLYAEGALSAVSAGEELVPARNWCRRQTTGHYSIKYASCSACSARRRWRPRSCAMRWIWHSQKNGCCGRPRRIGAARYEDGGGYTRGGAVEPSGTGRFGESHAAPWSPAPA